MRRIGSQSGEGRAGCLFWVFVLLAGFVVGSKVIPLKISIMQLEDHMKELADTQPYKPQNFFEKEIGNRARELGLDIPKDQIQVKKYDERVVMDVRFMVPLDFFVTTYEWNEHIHLDRDIFIF